MKKRNEDDAGLGHDPLAGESAPLLDALYGARSSERKDRGPRGRGHRQPLKEGRTFRHVTFSFYEEDVALLDGLLEEARAMGVRGASRSLIVRLALRQVSLEALKDRL